MNNIKTRDLKSMILIKPNLNQRLFTKLLPANYYTESFGFICKKELAIEKYLKVPLRVRLGSVEQSDYLEGKFSHPRSEQ